MLSAFLILGTWAGCLYALVALGLVLVRRIGGFVNFAHGAIVLVGAYGAYAAIAWTAGGFAVGLLAGICLACCLAVGLELLVYGPLRRRESSPLVLMIASLGVLVVVEGGVALLFGDQRLVLPFQRSRTLPVFGTNLTVTQVGSIVASPLLFVCLALLLRTKFGVMMRAVASDPELAAVNGIDINRVAVWVAVIAGISGALAGVLLGSDNDLTPTMGFRPLLYGLAGAIVGGFRGIASAAVGGLFVGVAEHVGVWRIPTQWQDAIVFFILLAFLLFRPEGLLGRKAKKATV